MKQKDLRLIIKEGEGLTVEFKEKYSPRISEDIVAFSNAKGGYILLGVNDQGKIIGETLTNKLKGEIISLARNCEPHINLKKISQIGKVIIIEIAEGDEKPYSCSSGYFRRLDAVTQKMAQKEVRAMFRESADIFFESLPCKNFGFEDVSPAKVRAFLKEAETSLKVNKDNLLSFLSSLSIYKDNKINNAGALMFAADINKFIPYSEMILVAFKGIDKMHIYDRKDVRNDLLTQLNEAVEFLKRHLNIRSEIHGFNRYDIYELPQDALREAVVNAIIHRDYSMRGTSIYVNIFDDRVEIVNPGGLPAGITKENFGKESVRRNLIIADLFHRMGKVERIGTGIEKMRRLMIEAKLKEPVFTSTTFFHAIFYRNPEYSLKPVREKSREKELTERLAEGLVERLVESQRNMLDLIKENPYISKKELSDKVGISTTAIDKNINQLKKKGLLRRIGPDRGGYWEVL